MRAPTLNGKEVKLELEQKQVERYSCFLRIALDVHDGLATQL